jgi:glycosyltransferase involved in cell wall biosynthesis
MNILIFSWRGPGHPHAGGAEIVTHEYAKAWVTHGYSVTVFTSAFPDAESLQVIDGVTYIRRGSEIISVQIHACVWYLTQNTRYDIVFDHFHGIPFFTPLYVHTKRVGFIHELAKNVWGMNSLPSYVSWIPALIGPIAEPFIFKLFYKDTPFITVSESTAKDLEDVGIKRSNINILANGIQVPSKLPRTKKQKNKTITYLGPLAKDKGYDLALDVFGKLYKKDKSYRFWMIGKGGDEEISNAKKIAKELGIAKAVTFWGYVSQSMKFKLLAQSHILINPSAHEGWGLVNIEANAVSTPVIAFDVSGNRDSIIADRTGLLVPYANINMMAEKINALLLDTQKYSLMQKSSQKWSSKFAWNTSIKKSINFLNEI